MKNLNVENIIYMIIIMAVLYSCSYIYLSQMFYYYKSIYGDLKRDFHFLLENYNKLKDIKKQINYNLLSKEQEKRFQIWQNKHKPLPYIGSTGGHFSLEITFTSIGLVVIAKNWKDETLDLTEYEKF